MISAIYYNQRYFFCLHFLTLLDGSVFLKRIIRDTFELFLPDEETDIDRRSLH